MLGLARLLLARDGRTDDDVRQAVELAERAQALGDGPRVDVLDVLATAYGAAGRYAQAVDAAQRALAAASRDASATDRTILEKRLGEYRRRAASSDARN